ncbi:hypothetical protein XENOCAPTIV_000429 [Xenoophorus captivus]|uniref:Uncharacterized protein n=1 Tax=Xenoophorus captivus TaxID=1517983 RepID=A0ABV0REX6_9TELE
MLLQSSHERRQVDGSISVLIMVLLNLLDCGNLGITLVSNRNRMRFLWEEVQVDWLELNGPGQPVVPRGGRETGHLQDRVSPSKIWVQAVNRL